MSVYEGLWGFYDIPGKWGLTKCAGSSKLAVKDNKVLRHLKGIREHLPKD